MRTIKVRNFNYLFKNNKPDLSRLIVGFTDAVGSFTCIIKDKPDKSGLVKLSYHLSQKK